MHDRLRDRSCLMFGGVTMTTLMLRGLTDVNVGGFN